MTIDHDLERAEWIRGKLSRVLDLIMHVRAQRLPSMQANRGPRVSGGGERTRAPMQLDPIDDADDVWAALCLVALELEQHTHERAPISFEQQRVTQRPEGGRFVQGFSTSDPYLIELQVVRLVGWLKAAAVTLALGAQYRDAVEHLAKTMSEVQGKYPEAPRPPRARKRCPKCGQFAVVSVFSLTGDLEQLRCEHCGAHRDFTS